MESAKCEIFTQATQHHHKQLAKAISASENLIPARAHRQIAPPRMASSIPPHIHDDNHTYVQHPAAKLTATIVGWREVKALTHYGVRNECAIFYTN